mmetsp:Transcript_88278/g.189524  ORF Transcript_88278/g.189524 Transcript_88278/m.189524 type:complete len:441 (+) Transcript_88278:83-1405(+)
MWCVAPGHKKAPKTKNGLVDAAPKYNRPAPRHNTAGGSKPGLGWASFTAGGKPEGLQDLAKELKANNGASSPTSSTPASPTAKDKDTKTTATPVETTTTTKLDPKVEPAKVDGKVPEPAAGDVKGTVRMLVCALDYRSKKETLNATNDARNMTNLAKACGVTDITTLLDERCTKKAFIETLSKVASKCTEDDFFIFYFAGHGTKQTDVDGDEADGKDEAFVCHNDELLLDDEFSAVLLKNLHKDARLLVLTDCCCSGTIADLDRAEWANRHAIAISGCKDEQSADETDKGGIFTHSMLLAADKLGDCGEQEQSVGMFYNATVKCCATVFDTQQDIVIHTAPGFKESELAWPFIPPKDYVAPMHEVAQAGDPIKAVMQRSFSPQAAGILNCTCDRERESLRKLGITPAQMALANPEKHLEKKDDWIDEVKGKKNGGGCSVM